MGFWSKGEGTGVDECQSNDRILTTEYLLCVLYLHYTRNGVHYSHWQTEVQRSESGMITQLESTEPEFNRSVWLQTSGRLKDGGCTLKGHSSTWPAVDAGF